MLSDKRSTGTSVFDGLSPEEQAEYLRKTTQRAGIQTKTKLRRGFHNAPLEYKIVSINQLTAVDQERVAKMLLPITNLEQAKLFIHQRGAILWGITYVPYDPRVAILTYKGVEVSVFYKRLTTTVVPAVGDPVPEGALENPDDVWIRFDLFGLSIRQQHKIVRNEVAEQLREEELQSVALNTAERTIVQHEVTIKSLTTQLENERKKHGNKQKGKKA